MNSFDDEYVLSLRRELAEAKNRLGNAEGALIDAGTYCAGPADIVNGIERVHRAAHMEGYHVGEGERTALATANSDLRSQLQETRARLYELEYVVHLHMETGLDK